MKIHDITSALGVSNTYDIVNAIRNSSGDTFQQYVPLANADNVAEVGAGIMLNQSTQNEFISSLVDRIGLVVLKQKLLNNDFKKFKKGSLPLGLTIEEIYTDITNENVYDAELAEEKVFARSIPDVKTLFHEVNRRVHYKQTIQDSSLTTAFVSWDTFNNFVSSIVTTLYNSSEVDEFKYMKLLIDNYMAKGHFKVLKSGIDLVGNQYNSDDIHNTVKAIRSLVVKMTLGAGSRDYNSYGVHTRTDKQDLHLIATADFDSAINVDVLAQAFNMDKATLLAEMTTIDSFATPGLVAVLVDRDFFMVYDKLQKMETIRNPQGLYWNYFFHVWQVLSASRFQNAVAIVDKNYEIDINNQGASELILSPFIDEVKAGTTQQFTVTPRMIIDTTTPPTNTTVTVAWTVESQNGVLEEGTTITDGLLTVAPTQTGTLIVKVRPTTEGATISASSVVMVKAQEV